MREKQQGFYLRLYRIKHRILDVWYRFLCRTIGHDFVSFDVTRPTGDFRVTFCKRCNTKEMEKK